ncbi:sodium [Arthrobacter sp. Hiyo4]|nr:sodium [Arthrobacter sp. Hiyo4]
MEALKDFEAQKKLGLDPVFNPLPLGITGATFRESYKSADREKESARM